MEFMNQAKDLAAFLIPFLPYLAKVGEGAAVEVGKQFTEDAWSCAKALWDRLRPKAESRAALREAVGDVIRDPENKDGQTIFQLQLKKLLAEDGGLALELGRLMQSHVVQQVLAERGSRVSGVEQNATGGTRVEQETTARDNSIVENVRQQQK